MVLAVTPTFLSANSLQPARLAAPLTPVPGLCHVEALFLCRVRWKGANTVAAQSW